MRPLLNWLDDRTGYRHILHEMLYEPIPGGARWRYVWGSTLTFTFFAQVVTGLFLWSAYSPSAQTAWASVYFIQHKMFLGSMVRGMHHFAAQAMMVLLALHFMQVVIDGAYRAPREINFWLGIILMQVVLGLSLTGYLLPWDQKGYYATQVATRIMGATPVIGPAAQTLAQGGSSYGHHTLTRFFALHAGILPALLVLFLVAHIYVFRRHSITVVDPHRRPETTFWPDQVLKDAVACLAVLATVLFFAVRYGAELSAPADPTEAYSAARPEWYFLFLFQFLKFEFIEHWGVQFGAIYVPGLVMLLIVLMPIVGRWRLGHRFNIGLVVALMIGIGYLTGLAMYKDRTNSEHRIAVETAEREGHRTAELADAFGIPIEGPRGLLRDDPLTQGPRIFARNCASCHRYHGHNGMELKVKELHDGQEVESPPTAADLGNFGSRDWLRDVLTDYRKHFAPLANAPGEAGEVGKRLLDGEMANWSAENRETLTKDANQQDFAALIEYLVSQSSRPDVAPIDQKLVERGKTIFESGELTDGALASVCTDCHTFQPLGSDKVLEAGAAPLLTGYAGAEWLKAFLRDPGGSDFYGYEDGHNAMPAFGEKLSDHDLDMLVRWLIGDYYRAKSGERGASAP